MAYYYAESFKLMTQPNLEPVESPMPVIRRERRHPRFVEPPKQKNQELLNRSDLIHRTNRDGKKPAFSRQRNIAGDLPTWNPEPPGGILIQRSNTTS